MRTLRDSFGEVRISDDALWSIVTQRSLDLFKIGEESFPRSFLEAFSFIKEASAMANFHLGTLDENRALAIRGACKTIRSHGLYEQFPLSIWQTGSGTHTNMNFNEVIVSLASSEDLELHPNDHVNKSQSTNDTFPAAMELSILLEYDKSLKVAFDFYRKALTDLLERAGDRIKIGRTHLQDATPIYYKDVIGAWLASLDYHEKKIEEQLEELLVLPLGATAVGSGINAPEGYPEKVCEVLSEITGFTFRPEKSLPFGISLKSRVVSYHSALTAFTRDLYKIIHDIRMLGSGPRCGLGELLLPENEAGSSIMPGKVNPSQIEALSMVCAKIFGHEETIGFSASQGHFELNAMMPVMIYDILRSSSLLAHGLYSFTKHCLMGIAFNDEVIKHHLEQSLMLVTALSKHIGYEKAAAIAKLAHEKNMTLKEASLETGLTDEDFDAWVDPHAMV